VTAAHVCEIRLIVRSSVDTATARKNFSMGRKREIRSLPSDMHRTISGTARHKPGPHDASRSSPLLAAEPALKEVGSCRRW
jgi:hypothetical protein